ncbi:MAG: penicillin-binding protein 1C, partial [Deltaproteobacteria bacterium]|nr:penicillin-binding protein 1C [Deltaproteobacteria bacterium]
MLKAILHWRLRGHHPFKWMCVGSFVLVAFIFLLIPTPQFETPLSTVLYDQSGELLSATVAGDEQWRFPPTDKLSEKFVHAITTFEDKRFYSHPGIDVLALGRAISDNYKEGR